MGTILKGVRLLSGEVISLIVQTHRLVGKFLYINLSQELKSKLDYAAFVWGNVKPDVLRKYKKVSHYYPENEDYVLKIFDEVMNENLSKREFSDRLGVLIHFLCDYTCIYHNNMKINNAHSMRKHMQYEINLHFYTLTHIHKAKSLKLIQFQNKVAIIDHIYDVINQANQDEATPNTATDFHEMMILSTSVLTYILKTKKFS